MSKKPSLLVGALVGFVLGAPLVILFFLGDALAGLPLLPYDIFDWMARYLPGQLVTFGIDSMVNLLILLRLDVASVAKTAEHIQAITGMLVTGAGAGAVFFAALNQIKRDLGNWPGILLGIVLGVPLALISGTINRASGSVAFGTLWILVGYIAWGAAIQWVYNNLSARQPHVKAAEADEEAMSVEMLDRRQFLIRVGTASAAITVVGAGLSALIVGGEEADVVTRPAIPATDEEAGQAFAAAAAAAADLIADPPNADDPLEPAPGTRPEYTPLEDHYQIDINSRPPEVDGASWTLPITGLVDNPIELTLADLQARFDPIHRFVTLACISNRVGGSLTSTTLWTGVSLQEVLAEAGIQSQATHLEITAADGFHESVALDLINADDRIMLTYMWDGKPLLQKHGYPLRIYIPNRYGMKQPKWITGIEATKGEREGYWVVRGWDHDAIMNATSVVDAVGDVHMTEDITTVPIGGIAHAGDRGISKVEVRIDGGEWQQAELRGPLSDTTWVIWRYDWPFEEGTHVFEVECYDGDGAMQSTAMAPPRPSGATGIHSLRMRL